MPSEHDNSQDKVASNGYVRQVEKVFSKARTLERWWAGKASSSVSISSGSQPNCASVVESANGGMGESAVPEASQTLSEPVEFLFQIAGSESPRQLDAKLEQNCFVDVEALAAGAIPVFGRRQLAFRWGGCPTHLCVSPLLQLLETR